MACKINNNEYETIMEVPEIPRDFITPFCFSLGLIYLNETDCAAIKNYRFRADLGVVEIYTDKVIDVAEIDKDKAQVELDKALREYNKNVIENDEKLLAYCKVHKLAPEETDADELKKIVGVKNNNWKTRYDFVTDRIITPASLMNRYN